MMQLRGSDPRPYRDESDLEKMRVILQNGRKSKNGTYYVHVGDLNWWLFYPAWAFNFSRDIFVWDDPLDAEHLNGWALLSSEWCTFDVCINPMMRGTPSGEQMYFWAEEKITAIARASGKAKIRVMWIGQDDLILDEMLTMRGFQRVREDVCMTCSLEQPIPMPFIQTDYVLRSVLGEEEAQARAAAQHGAFNSSTAFELYSQRYLQFMRSPVYSPELNVVAVAADKRIGAFCIVWLDTVNRVGYFEPVGTHPDFQQKGLGRGVMLEGLHRLKERGMTSASVCTSQDNLPAIKLYESVGFRIINRLGLYEKDIRQ